MYGLYKHTFNIMKIRHVSSILEWTSTLYLALPTSSLGVNSKLEILCKLVSSLNLYCLDVGS